MPKCDEAAGFPEVPTVAQAAIAVAAASVAASIPSGTNERHSRREGSPMPNHECAGSQAPEDHCSSDSDSFHLGEFASSLESHRRGSKSRGFAGAFRKR